MSENMVIECLHVEARTASNNQGFVDRIECPIAKCQGGCGRGKAREDLYHRAAI